jgi:hypothetical protein
LKDYSLISLEDWKGDIKSNIDGCKVEEGIQEESHDGTSKEENEESTPSLLFHVLIIFGRVQLWPIEDKKWVLFELAMNLEA